MTAKQENPDKDDNLFEINRRALMESYNTQTVTHGTYLLALVGALLAIVPQWESIYKLTNGKWIFFLILATIGGGGIYIILRTLFWAYLTSDVLQVEQDRPLPAPNYPLILRIQVAILEDFNQRSYMKRAHVAYVIGNSSPFKCKIPFVILLIGICYAVVTVFSIILR